MTKVKKYQGGVPELMTPRMASVKTADIPLVSGTPKEVSVPKPSFMDKAGDFMGSYGNIIGSVGTGIASLINANKKQDPTGKPYKTGTNMIKSKKSKLIKYQAGAEDIIGPGPLDNLPEMSPKQLKEFNDYDSKKEIKAAIERVDAMGPPVTPLSPRMASISTANIPAMSPKMSPNVAPPQKQSRRERKQENERLFKMAIKGDNIEYMTPKTPKLNINIPDKQPIMKMVEQQPATGKKPKMFDYNSAEAKGGYTRALKGGRTDAKGNLIDMETGLIYKDLRKTTKGGNKPLVKMKEDSWTENQWKDFLTKRNNPVAGQELVRMSNQNPYASAGFNIPFNQPSKQVPTQKIIEKPVQKVAKANESSFGFAKDNVFTIGGQPFSINPLNTLIGTVGTFGIGKGGQTLINKYGGKVLGKGKEVLSKFKPLNSSQKLEKYIEVGKPRSSSLISSRLPKSAQMKQAQYDKIREYQYQKQLAQRPQLTEEQLKNVANKMAGIKPKIRVGVGKPNLPKVTGTQAPEVKKTRPPYKKLNK